MDEAELNQDYLKSERGIDYRPLRALLAVGDWKAADAETTRIVHQCLDSSSVPSNPFLDFPCTDLISLDRLWLSHSQQQFGFSIQVQIYLECLKLCEASGGQISLQSSFADRLIWSSDRLRLSMEEPSFDASQLFNSTNPYRGHLPSVSLKLYSKSDNSFTNFVHRLFRCSVTPPAAHPTWYYGDAVFQLVEALVSSNIFCYVFLRFEQGNLLIAGSLDLSYYHQVELWFEDVSYLQLTTAQIIGMKLRLATVEERQQVDPEELEDGHQLFVLYEGDPASSPLYFIGARTVKARKCMVYYGKRQDLRPGEENWK